eukprot:s3833_g5.t1
MAELSDLCYCRVIGEGSLVPVIGWVVEAADEELVLATTSDLTTLEHTSQVKVSDKLIYFVRVARDTASLEPPAGWKGDKPKDLAPLETCRTAWTKAKDNELRSSEAEGTEGEGFFSCRFGSAAGPLCRGDSEAEEESDSEGESAFPPKKGRSKYLPPGGSGDPANDKKKKPKGEKDLIKQMLAKGLAEGKDANDLLPTVLKVMLLDKEPRRSRAASSRDYLDLHGGSDSDDSDADEDKAKGMKAVELLHKLHRSIRRHPKKVCEQFEKEVIEDLGVVKGQAWTLKDYVKKQQKIQEAPQNRHYGRGGLRVAQEQSAGCGHGPGDPELKVQIAGSDAGGRLGLGLAPHWIAGSFDEEGLRRHPAGNVGDLGVPGRSASPSEARSGEQGPRKPPCRGRGKPFRGGGHQEVIPFVCMQLSSAGATVVHPVLAGANSDSSFIQYFAWFQGVQGYLLERSSEGPLFPCALPYPEAILTEEVRGEAAEVTMWWSKAFLNAFVGWGNFVTLGCPAPKGSGREPRVSYRACRDIRAFTDKLLGEMGEFVSLELVAGRLACDGKRSVVESMLAQVQCTVGASYFHDGAAAEEASTVALPVDCYPQPGWVGGSVPVA